MCTRSIQGQEQTGIPRQQVAAFLAMMVGHAVSSQVHNDCSHWPSCCPSKEQDSLELPKLSTASVSPPEPLRDTSHTDSCKASNDGPLNRRSISPWSYELDRDLNRVPQDLYHARCLCTHCASLQRGSHMGLMGNSVPLYHNQTVFYRRPCHGQQGCHHGYCLERRLYPVSFACVCVRPLLKSS
ncbi:interleukin-25 isoform X1 [Cricetulus griseus]|uniref:Interleukin-25 isoform X1 n=1 Tax=Cricetulus griseus TaxID=10029 RepID=A0A9J7J9K8_CRIGR|nr:interleukin-25 isoform X1 [Cricetulus griseus]XP_007644786.1 interleukin-25 isoform X1 [Cricetulus griseus]XP_007644787.1 interleukin-25 isoform X1 [Cricetulus griseus]XP_027246399.1 interleukin-25 isoform X1 [Cricetulus griseus]XP_027246400.1 interleukin-25 isoform X1 [Cricetulus griseus]XP_027246401.1 interleukin-25 isoform X1 [Cricetulus griseus]XP_027246402.1 interleukin-25 isoform X1 [Cricetulus griseus]XP_027246403.1 interleukin-25 isoform X1 [Cricetulus griseus]XP_027294884.1 inte